MIRDLFAKWGNRCLLCGRPFTLANPPTLEHIKPKSLGGTNAHHNLALSHQSCNSIRGNASFVAAALLLDGCKGTSSNQRKHVSDLLKRHKIKSEILCLQRVLSQMPKVSLLNTSEYIVTQK